MTRLRFALASCLLIAACNRSSTHYLQLGNDLFKAGKFEDASINYRKAIQKNASFGEAYYRLGLADIKNHLPLNALADLRKARELMPGNHDVLVSLTELTITTYTLDPKHPKDIHNEASKLVEQLRAKNPDGFDSNRLSGALALVEGKPADAVQYLRRADGAKAGDMETEMGLAQALLADGQDKEGAELARSLIERDETYAKAYDLLADYYHRSGKAQEAEEILKQKISNNPDHGDYVLQLARLYVSEKKPELIAPILKTIMDRPSAFPDARLAIGDFYSSMGNEDEALRQYEEGLNLGPKDTTPYRTNIIRIFSAQRKWPQAYEQVDLLFKEHPQSNDAKLLRVALWMEEGKPENLGRAISELRAQLSAKPKDPAPLHYQLGSALLAEGDRDGARGEWIAALQKPGYLEPRVDLAQLLRDEGRTDEALKLSNEVLKLAPDDARGRILHATCMAAAGKYAESRSELEQLSADRPKWWAPHYELAVLDLNEKKYPEAEAAFGKLRAELPAGNYAPIIGLVDSYVRQDRAADAIRLLQDELRRTPGALPLRMELARQALGSGSYDLAIEQYKSVAATAPGAVEPQKGMIQAYLAKGDTKTAMDLLGKASQSQPNSVAIKSLTADVQEKMGQIAQAKDTYRQILASENDNSAALNNLAFLMADTGDNLDEAMKLAKAGVQTVSRRNGLPVDVEIDGKVTPAFLGFATSPEVSRNAEDRKLAENLLDTIGWIYLKKKMPDNAVKCSRAAVRDNPSIPDYHYHLGVALISKGDKQQARTEFTSALADKPVAAQESAIRELLARL